MVAFIKRKMTAFGICRDDKVIESNVHNVIVPCAAKNGHIIGVFRTMMCPD